MVGLPLDKITTVNVDGKEYQRDIQLYSRESPERDIHWLWGKNTGYRARARVIEQEKEGDESVAKGVIG